MRQFLLGDVPLDQWVPHRDGEAGEPWKSFERARQLAETGQHQQAIQIWLQIATTGQPETRHILQAWHFLRQAGCLPPQDRAKLALGAVAEMPAQDAHDVLAAYQDGTVRYLNYSGKVLAWEDRSHPKVQSAVNHWLTAAQAVASVIGPWDQPSLPPVPASNARLMVLTPSGPHFGQGPAADLSADPLAQPFLTAATTLLQLIVSLASA
jgi:hypothetical protein